jgi:hypothetical protein
LQKHTRLRYLKQFDASRLPIQVPAPARPQDDRIQIRHPRRNLQIKFTRSLSERNDFVAHMDSIGKVEGTHCLIEWNTARSRYSEKPEGLLALDPWLVCCSWITGIAEVALVVFVRKRMVEVQYLRTSITNQQREEFGELSIFWKMGGIVDPGRPGAKKLCG